MDIQRLQETFEKWLGILRLTESWDVRLELVDDPSFHKTGDFRVDCDDKKAVLLLNVQNPIRKIRRRSSSTSCCT